MSEFYEKYSIEDLERQLGREFEKLFMLAKDSPEYKKYLITWILEMQEGQKLALEKGII